jgi:hypothetical protein
VGGRVECVGAIHEDDDLAIVVDDAGERRLYGPIFARGPKEE